MYENGRAEYKRFCGIYLKIWTDEEIRNIPESIKMGDVVNSQSMTILRNKFH